jgi:hypothetical protein
MKSQLDKVMQRPVAMGDIAELMALTLGLMAVLSNVPHQVLSSALGRIAEGAKSKDQAIVLRYIAAKIAETGAQFEETQGPKPEAKH